MRGMTLEREDLGKTANGDIRKKKLRNLDVDTRGEGLKRLFQPFLS